MTLTTPGQQAELSFSVAGTTQPITVRLTGNAIGNVVVKLLRADRTLVTSKASTSTTFTLPQQSLAPGDYIVVVDPYETNTGSINVAATNP